MLEPRAAVRNLHAYRPPLAGRQGLRLDFNESTIGCSPRVLARLRALDAELLATYPERESVEVQVARFLGLNPSQVLLTNGIDEAIHLVCSTFLESGDEALIVVPTFAMYSIFAAAEAANVVQIPAGTDFAFPLKDLLSRISERTRFIAVANPNNPTGASVTPDLLLQIARAAPNAALLVDEAYFEFHGETIIDQVGCTSNLFVARTFSKAYGLAGLRCGILALASSLLGTALFAAFVALPEALADQEYVECYAAEVRQNRELLQQKLGNLGLHYWPSHANFVLIRIGEAHASFVEALRSCGILVRDRDSDPGCAGCVRLTVGSDHHTKALVSALHEAVEQLDLRHEVKA